MKPVALLVQAQKGAELLHLRDEVKAIRQDLREAGFQVITLTSPTLESIKSLLSSPRFRDRVCIFHYAGHANGKGVILQGNDGEMAYMQGFAKLLKHQQALRLVFMNGCLTHDHLLHFDGMQDNLTLVVTRAYIRDGAATQFAMSFYNALKSSNVNRAFDEAEGALQAANELPQDVMRLPHDVAEMQTDDTSKSKPLSVIDRKSAGPSRAWPWMLTGSREFHIADSFVAMLPFSEQKRQLIGRRILGSYIAILAIVAIIFAFMSHRAKSSPAWQAEFGYGLTESEIPKRLTQNSPRPIRDSVPSPLINDSRVFGPDAPCFGVVVESLRALMVLVILLLTAGYIYNEVLPSDPQPFRPAWFRSPLNLSFLALAILVFIFVVIYHLIWAPRLLDNNEEIWNLSIQHEDWRTRKDGAVWANAGDEWFEQEAVNAFFKNEPLPLIERMKTPIWHRMYSRPYLWYLPYSLVNFVFVAVPLLFVMTKGTCNSFRRVELYLAMMPCVLRKGGDESKAVRLLKETFVTIGGEMERYLLMVFLILSAALFESLLGHRTLASVAIATVIFAMLLFALGVVVILAILARYHKDCLDIEGHLSEEKSAELREAIERYSVLNVLRRPLTAALLGADLAAFSPIAYWALSLLTPQ